MKVDRSTSNAVTFKELTTEERERLIGVARGTWWVKATNGVLEFAPATQTPPDPVEDPLLSLWWPRKPPKVKNVQVRMRWAAREPGQDAHFSIQSLCGYYYTEEKYKIEAEKLTGFGFECLRSRRGSDGGYWEIWYLPGLWSASGELKDEVDRILAEGKKWSGKHISHGDKRVVNAVVNFLCKNVSFGTLDVGVQRAAMVVDD